MKNKTSRIFICAALLLACASLTACSAAPAAASPAGSSTTQASRDDTSSKTLAELEAEADQLRAEIEAQKEALAEQEALAERDAAEARLQAKAEVERAKDAALRDAGLTEAEVTFTKAIEERDDGKIYIGVEFYTDSALYDYEIDPSADCAVHEKSMERFHVDDAQATPAGTIGVARAKEIAAAHVGESLDALVFSKAKLENDGGRAVYELEFFRGGTAYEYTIDAATGDILESEMG